MTMKNQTIEEADWSGTDRWAMRSPEIFVNFYRIVYVNEGKEPIDV